MVSFDYTRTVFFVFCMLDATTDTDTVGNVILRLQETFAMRSGPTSGYLDTRYEFLSPVSVFCVCVCTL